MSLSTETEETLKSITGDEAAPAPAPAESPAEEPRVNAGALPPTEQEPAFDPLDTYTKPAKSADASGDIDPRDRQFLAALGKVLEHQNRTHEKADEPALERFAFGVVRKGVGVISLALILVLMGVVLICCLFSPTPDYLLPAKLAPIAAILVGLEILVHYFTSGKHFRVHIPSICISAALVVGCCIMAASMNKSYSATKTEYNNRSVASQIYDSSYNELRYVADIASLDVTVDLNPDGTGMEKGLEALSTDDIVKVDVVLDGSYSTPREFADECKSIIDGYRILGIPVTEFTFSSTSRFNSFNLTVEGKFAQDFSEAKLAEQVSHIYVEDYDYLDDLEDYEDFLGLETEESLEAE